MLAKNLIAVPLELASALRHRGRHLALLTASQPGDRPGHGAASIYAAGRIWTERVRVLEVRLSTGHPTG